MKHLLLALILLLMSLPVAAQTERVTKQERPVWINVYASIQDSFNKSGLGGRYSLVIMRPDSTVIRRSSHGMMSRMGGHIAAESSLGKMELGKSYIVRVECDGYEPTYVNFTVTRKGRSSEMHLPSINLKLKQKRTALGSEEMMETTMKEVAVKASKVQFVWHGDTLIYHADAFNLPQAAMLEDLIRQLPGVELLDNGEIRVNGRRVDCLTLNGRDFFRGNNKVLMQNLPYYTVKDLKVYERESELNRYLGRQAEQNDYVMDVQLKREYRRGYMANAEAGYGTQDRWLARAFGLRYGDASRMTLIANANNLNENRQPGYNGNWSPANQPAGIKQLERVDADFQFYGPENRWEQTLEGSVEWERGENATRSFSMHEYQQTIRRSTSAGSSIGKRFATNVNHQFLMRNPFFLNVNTSFAWNRNRTWEEDSARVSTDTVDVNRTMNRHYNHGNGWSLGERLWARYKFPWGDDIGLNASGSYSSSRDRRFQDYDLLLFDDASRDHRLHYRRNEGTVHNVHLGATYTMALPPWWQLELKADFDHGRSQQDNPLWRLEQDSTFLAAAPALGQTPAELGRLLDDENSQWTDNTHNEGQLGLGLRYSHETYRGNDANFPRSRLDFYTYAGVRDLYENEHFIRDAVDTLMRRHRWLPTVKSTFNYQNNPAHFSVSANYELTRQLPSLSMQAGYRDTSNPLSVSFANPSLRPTTRHSVQGQLRQGIKGYNRGSVNVSYHVETTRNQLAPSLRYNLQTGGYLRTTENVNGNWQLSLTPGTTFYVDKNRRHVLSSSFGMTWQDIVYLSSDKTALEPARTVTHRFRLDAKVDFTCRLSTRFDIQPTVRYVLDHGSSSLLNRKAVNARDFSYGFSLHWTLPLDIQLATDAKMYHRRGYGSAEMNTNDLIWNMQLSRALDRRHRFTLKAVAYDLLGQVCLNTYHINDTGYTSTWQRGIPRYVLFSLFYRMDVKPAKH